MAVIAILLVVTILSMANDAWDLPTDGYSNAAVPAKCVLGARPESFNPDAFYEPYVFYTQLVSALIITLAFFARIITLHKTLSVGLFGLVRLWAESWARLFLRSVLSWIGKSTPSRGLRWSLCYRPLLAVFFTLNFVIKCL